MYAKNAYKWMLTVFNGDMLINWHIYHKVLAIFQKLAMVKYDLIQADFLNKTALLIFLQICFLAATLKKFHSKKLKPLIN